MRRMVLESQGRQSPYLALYRRAFVTGGPMSPPAVLQAALDPILGDARLCATPLPGADLSLWLIDPANMERAFSPEETRRILEEPPYWCFCWASGLVLARWLAARPEWVRGQRVLDFGAGSGVAAAGRGVPVGAAVRGGGVGGGGVGPAGGARAAAGGGGRRRRAPVGARAALRRRRRVAGAAAAGGPPGAPAVRLPVLSSGRGV